MAPKYFNVPLLWIALVWLCQGLSAQDPRAQERTRIVPASGEVEFEQLRIIRWATLGGAPEADLTNMEIQLWFPSDWEQPDLNCPALVHIQELSPIEDDTGRLLTTEKRLSRIVELQGEVRSKTWKNWDGKRGPVVELMLDAPARGANSIRMVKGKAEVTLTKPRALKFDDLKAINGQELSHPDFEELAAMKLRFSIEEDQGGLTAKLTAPIDFSSPRNRGRLLVWDISTGNRRVAMTSEGGSRAKEGFTEEKSFRGKTIENLSLRLVVLEAVESKTFEFDFRNVPFP